MWEVKNANYYYYHKKNSTSHYMFWYQLEFRIISDNSQHLTDWLPSFSCMTNEKRVRMPLISYNVSKAQCLHFLLENKTRSLKLVVDVTARQTRPCLSFSLPLLIHICLTLNISGRLRFLWKDFFKFCCWQLQGQLRFSVDVESNMQ